MSFYEDGTNIEMKEGSAQGSSQDCDAVRCMLLDRVSKSSAFFKNQQRGEADLTVEQKWEIANEILNKSHSLFLQRFGKYLEFEDLVYFEPYRNIYDVEFYLKEIKKRLDSKRNTVNVRNRRYEALQKLIKEGTYFSDREMKKRNPLLYEEMVEKYMSDSEREEAEKLELKDFKFSTFLMEHIEREEVQNRRQHQEDEENAVWEEGDSDSDEEEEMTDEISEHEKLMLRNEFMNIMYENFLAGKDEDFEYSKVDDNTEYDSLQLREADEEEEYFDSEEPEFIESS
ncbi:coiled-coil domain-containing protein 97-like [Limulus polyphemus]|uniref:Coiled-coil domain-containing protein 97-like n=1 Tax=Limulus polyphemus TaxID=6850 RepID=A0ABM1C550_LIMPO|nr:coiled-coil domain-containing protein 97-like [Limulus polyphemus]XP_013794347.1 coiled-coil domain-containing protein 97-like [Limulus polyphemus]XP_022237654.1 coiled-coil domain-containing protein 97-like [Limulus polyphemus]